MLKISSDKTVAQKFEGYPSKAKNKLTEIRNLILAVAEETEEITTLEETLKWGEPSYLNKHGSTLRIDWKEKAPGQVALYFKCTSLLVPSFKQVFGNLFQYEKNRAILFGLEDKIPEEEIRACIKATLLYHKVKKQPLLEL